MDPIVFLLILPIFQRVIPVGVGHVLKSICYRHGRQWVGNRRTCPPHTFESGGDIILLVPHAPPPFFQSQNKSSSKGLHVRLNSFQNSLFNKIKLKMVVNSHFIIGGKLPQITPQIFWKFKFFSTALKQAPDPF